MTPHITPSWLVRATETTSYLDEVWNTLSIREQQRVYARSSTRARSRKPSSSDPQSVDPVLLDYYSTSCGLSAANKFFNRYSDVLPYDRNRVKAPGIRQRYLNASWIQPRASKRWFIATQAPLLWTANSFLSLTIEDNETPDGEKVPRIHTIVQLTQEHEGHVRKADAYFPNKVGHAWTIPSENEAESPSLEVKLVKQTNLANRKCVQSELIVRPSDSEGSGHTVTHLLYTGWPDHGVPEDRESLLRFIRHVEVVNGAFGDLESAPIAVGCSAGIGRTGSFIAISSLLGMANWIELQNITRPASPRLTPSLEAYSEDLVAYEVDWLREQRGGMVQKREQMELIYRILLLGRDDKAIIHKCVT